MKLFKLLFLEFSQSLDKTISIDIIIGDIIFNKFILLYFFHVLFVSVMQKLFLKHIFIEYIYIFQFIHGYLSFALVQTDFFYCFWFKGKLYLQLVHVYLLISANSVKNENAQFKTLFSEKLLKLIVDTFL